MTPQEIQERNKQIALMLGWKITDGIISYIPEENSFQHEVGYSASGFLQFDSDWNWLHEAIEFISKGGFSYCIYKNDKLYCCSIRIDRTTTDFILIKNKSQKEAVFISVSDFAQKFNNKEL